MRARWRAIETAPRSRIGTETPMPSEPPRRWSSWLPKLPSAALLKPLL